MANRKKPEVFVKSVQKERHKTMIAQDKNMNRVTKILSILCVFVIISTVLGLYNSISFTGNFVEINTKFGEINKRLDSINDTVFKLTDVYSSEVISRVGKSVVQIISFPPKSNEKGVALYVDNNGKKWGVGTGFSIDNDGNILTAYHVIENAEEVSIVLKNGTIIPVLGSRNNPELDVSILFVKSSVPPVEIGAGEDIRIGSRVAFIGFPLGDPIKIPNEGIISEKEIGYKYRNIPVLVYIISSFVNRGNSGGPVFSLETGKVIGIINQKTEVPEGFAISTMINQGLINEIRK
jgi:S1-C subfamily serine protease